MLSSSICESILGVKYYTAVCFLLERDKVPETKLHQRLTQYLFVSLKSEVITHSEKYTIWRMPPDTFLPSEHTLIKIENTAHTPKVSCVPCPPLSPQSSQHLCSIENRFVLPYKWNDTVQEMPHPPPSYPWFCFLRLCFLWFQLPMLTWGLEADNPSDIVLEGQ